MEPASQPASRPLLKKTLPDRRPRRPAGSAPPAVVSLSWENEDIENRWGLFKGGRFTRVNKLFSFILAAISSAVFLWLMSLLKQSSNPGLQQLGLYFLREKNVYAT